MCGKWHLAREGVLYRMSLPSISGIIKTSLAPEISYYSAAVKYDLDRLFQRLCIDYNSRLNQWRRDSVHDATGVARQILGTDRVAAMLSGEVLGVWRCENVTILYRHSNGSVDGTCYVETPVKVQVGQKKLLGYMNPLTMEVFVEGTRVDCSLIPHRIVMLNGTAIDQDGAVLGVRVATALILRTSVSTPKVGMLDSRVLGYNTYHRGNGAIGPLISNLASVQDTPNTDHSIGSTILSVG